MLERLSKTGSEPTQTQLDALRAYSGWGGCADAFSDKPEWQDINTRLRTLLDEDQYAAARGSTLTAFYTPGAVVAAMWGVLDASGLGGPDAHILEPGCGTGNFLSTMPPHMNAHLHGVELDPVSARIASLLNPHAHVANADLADTLVADGSLDAAIGNVPYSGDIRLPYTIGGQSRQLPLHDYFIERAVDALRPGGMAVLLTSRHTLDKRSEATRADLARKAELVAAVRLPNSTFSLQAGTEAVTDVLVLRKRPDTLEHTPDERWVHTFDMQVAGRADSVAVNSLIAHDGHTVGRIQPTTGRFGADLDVRSDLDTAAIGERLRELLDAQLLEAGPCELGERASLPMVAARPKATGVYEYTVDDMGVVWYGDETGVEPVASGDGDDARRLRGLVGLRDDVHALQRLEMDAHTSDEDVEQARRALNEHYAAFAAEFGRISSRANVRAYDRDEISWPLMQSLEYTDSHGRFTGLAPLFSRRVLTPSPPMPEHADSIQDAFSISMDRMGRVDTGLIGRLVGMRADEAAEALGDLVVTDPDTGRIMPADDYLSGDVISKATHVRALARTVAMAPHEGRDLEWRRSHGIDEPKTGAAAQVDEWIDMIGGTAWQSLVKPTGTNAYKDPAWAIARGKDWSLNLDYNHALATAIACRMLDEADTSDLRLTRPRVAGGHIGPMSALHGRDGANPVWRRIIPKDEYTSGVFAGRVPMYDAAVYLDRVVRADGLDAGDRRAAVSALFECDRDWRDRGRLVDSALGAAIRRIMPQDADTASIVDTLIEDPAVSEYLLANITPPAERPRAVHDAQEQTMRAALSAEGLDAWRRERSRFMRDWDAGHASMLDDARTRAESLGRLADRLDEVRPLALDADSIIMPLGAPWIPPCDVFAFMVDTFDVDASMLTPAAADSHQVDYMELTGQWRVAHSAGKDIDADVARRFGTSERNPFQLLEACLNNQQVRVTREQGDGTRVTDQAATMAAVEAMRAIRDAWSAWLGEHPDVTERLAAKYNRTFNCIRPRQVDGSYISTPDIADGIELRTHQKNAVARALRADEGTLIAHVVGAGKTFEGCALVHEAKRLGRASKPMIVVPNHLTGQWAADYMRLYPTARILVMDNHDTSSSQAARRFWGRVATGDWDAVIVPESRFSQLHVSRTRRERSLEERVGQYVDAIRDATAMQGDRSPTVKRLEGARKRVETALNRLRTGKENRDDAALRGLEFERLGVDMLFVDEAHHFKNLGVPVASSDLGMQVASAAKCEDMLDKCDLLREQGHGANIVFATGTPVSNSMSELYNMCRYLAPRTLDTQGTASFAAWAGAFGQVVPTVELKPEGTGFQVKQRFARFSNLPELMAGVKQFTDMVTNDDIDLDLPEVEQIPVAVPAEPEQEALMRSLADRADAVRSGGVPPEEDNMLAITSDGRKIALDPKLLDSDDTEREPLEGGKVEACASNVAGVWRRTAADRGAQLVFCDTSTPASGKWNIYDDLKRRLTLHGVPAEQIAFVHDAGDNPRRREDLFAKVRDGRIRVLIGSTQKLGTGTNVQTRLAAVHDLDCPWRPADLEQRLGRIQRQGNMYGRVQVYRYVAEGTFDAYSWQTVERKQRFISQIMSSKTPAREASDLDETVLDYAAIKAIATGDPTIQRRMSLENDINQLTLLRQAHARRKSETRNEIDLWLAPAVAALETTKRALDTDGDALRTAADSHRSHMTANRWEGMNVNGRRLSDRQTANLELYRTARAAADGTRIATYHGFDVIARRNGENRVTLTLRGSCEHPMGKAVDAPSASNSAAGPLPALDRFIRARAAQANSIDADLAEARRRLAAAQRAAAQPWEREHEYRTLKNELALLGKPTTGETATAAATGGRERAATTAVQPGCVATGRPGNERTAAETAATIRQSGRYVTATDQTGDGEPLSGTGDDGQADLDWGDDGEYGAAIWEPDEYDFGYDPDEAAMAH